MKKVISLFITIFMLFGILPLQQSASAINSTVQVNFVNVYPTEAYANSKIKVIGQPGAVYTFRQSTSNGQFSLQGNDIPGTLNDGTRDIPGNIVRRDSDGGTTYAIWFQPTTPGNGVAAGYFLVLNGLNRTYTNNQLVQVNSANLSDIVTTLNQYLAAQQAQLASAPTVNPLVTADTTPTLTGTVDLSTAGTSIEVVVNGQTYTTSNGVSVSGNTWSLTIPNGNALNYQSYEVTAKLVRPNTYALIDGTSNELTITNAPYIQSLVITSTPSTYTAKDSTHSASSDIYLASETVEVTATFSAAVTITGSPKLAIQIGNTTVQASYATGSGTTAIKFQYVIQAGQVDVNGISLPQDAISLNGGTIQDNMSQNATLLTDVLTDQAGHKVDAKAPQLLSLDYSSTSGSSIVMQYSDDFNLDDATSGGAQAPNGKPLNVQFTISKTSGGTTTTHSPISVSVDASNKKVTLDLGALSVSQGDTLQLTYVDAQGYNDIQDISGNDAAPFSLQLVNLDADDIDGITSEIESAGRNGGDANGDGIPDKKQNGIVQAPLTSKADFDGRSSSSNVNSFGTIAAGNLSQSNRAAALTGNALQLMTNTKISNVNMQSRSQLTGAGRNNVIAKSDVYEFNLVPESGSLVDLDSSTTGTQVRVIIDLPTPIAADTYMKKKSVNGSDVWFPFLDDQDLSTYDSGATLVKDNNGLVTRVVLTITDGGLGDYDGLANNVIVDPGFLAETDKAVTITMSDYALTNGETSVVTFTFADQVLGFTASDVTVQNGALGTLSGPFTNVDGTVYYTAVFTPTANFVDATNVVTVAANSYTDVFSTNGTGGTSSNYTIDTTVPAPAPSDRLITAPLDMTNETDSGSSQNDEITSNGNPILTFLGEFGLTVELVGPGGVPLLNGTHYRVVYLNGVYTVTLLDAVPGGSANPFGTYANGIATNNPAGTGDGTYTIIATDLGGNRGTVGTFVIDTTPANLNPGPSPIAAGPLDMTDATDSGSSQDDEITSNGNPVLTFPGEEGLTIELDGPGGVPLVNGTHYSVVYSNGVYTVTLLDAVPGGIANPFGTYANGVVTNNPTGTGDGTYSIIATDIGGNRGTVGTFVIDTTPADLNPGPSLAKVGPLDMTDVTDTGSSQDDEVTSNGNPVLTFPGEEGLTIELVGPGGVALVEGQHYNVVYGNGVYTVTLLDSVPGGSANPFGTYANGVATNNPAGTGDGTYTIFAVDKAGNRGIVGTFVIDTTPADLNPGTSPAKIGPLDMTDASDTGSSQDDEVTSNGNPVLTFPGEEGLTIELVGPGGVALVEVQHYNVVYANGVYTVTLLDAVPGGSANPFGTYANGVATNNPAGTGDGTYTIFAVDKAGNRGVVGTFVIDTTPANLNPGPSPAKLGPLDMTDATDSGASADDENTSNGNPELFFTGEAGLTIELYGPDQTKLVEGQHYSVVYADGVYTVKLIDAVPGGVANPFGTYTFNGATGNPAATADGTYTIKAVDKAGNRATVGTFVIETTLLKAKTGTHTPYIKGYPDKTFRADRGITRAEIATIVFRTITRAKSNAVIDYSDVAANFWGKTAIDAATQMGVIAGYADGTFGANQKITRAEFATIIARLIGDVNLGTKAFGDVDASHWAYANIQKVAAHGLISGYADGSFKPDAYLTRTEAVTIYNRFLNRGPLNGVTKSTWKDVPASFWALNQIEEASVQHNYEIRSDLKEYLK